MKWTPGTLIAFERDIADEFNAGKIKAPVHLSGGNEHELIAYFAEHYRPGDWIVSSWRSHYHCLLAGVPPLEVKAAIMRGSSITLCFPDHRIISSAIVGGALPIGLGIALAIRRGIDALVLGGHHPGLVPHVHVFLGDMAAKGGMYHEVHEYAAGHRLPISFVIEDNGKSVGTPTLEVWGFEVRGPREERHIYELPWPHSGAGQWVRF